MEALTLEKYLISAVMLRKIDELALSLSVVTKQVKVKAKAKSSQLNQ